MHAHRALPIVALTAIASILAAFTLVAPTSNTLMLPVEVMSGADGATETVTLQASNGGSASSIYIQAHSISYPSHEEFNEVKASIRVNNGAWVDLTNREADCLSGTPEREFFECLGGPYPTIRFTLPADISGGLRDGTNLIEFRYNRATADESPDAFGTPSSGFRILDIDIWSGPGSSMMDGTTKTFDNPTTWAPPGGYDNASDVEAGEDLWNARDRLVDGPGTHPIVASCGDCHASDGADLKYFAFSNKSIVARSKWHGLTDNEGKQIAAYIRSRVLKDRDTGETYEYGGYAWSPVYQPGPSAVSSRSPDAPRTSGTAVHDMPGNGSQFLAGGAGVDWALDEDSETVPYLFPGGASQDDVLRDMQMWHVPIALQYPDWNEWLPVHHPLDMWGNRWKSIKSGGRGWSPHDNWYGGPGDDRNFRYSVEQCFDSAGPTETPRQCVERAEKLFSNFFEDTRQWQNREEAAAATPRYDGNKPNHWNGYAFRRVNGYKFQSVKQWEISIKYDLDDEYQKVHPGADDLQFTGGSGRWVFDQAPHLSHQYAGPEFDRWDLWLDNVWYEINTQHNHGKGVRNSVRPNDWAYQHMHSNAFQWLPARHTRSAMKMLEVCNSPVGSGPFGNGDNGAPNQWYQRVGHCNLPSTMIWRDWVVPGLNGYQGSLGGQALEMQFRAVVENMMYGQSPVSYNQSTGTFAGDVDANWERRTGEKGWEPESYEPRYGNYWGSNDHQPSHYLMGLQFMKGQGVKPSLLDSAAVWLDAMNPSSKWREYRCSSHGGDLDCPGASLLPGGGDGSSVPPSSVGIGGRHNGAFFGSGYDVPQGDEVTLVCSAVDENGGGIGSMSFMDNGNTIHTATPSNVSNDDWNATYTYTPATGTHTIRCSATDDGGTTESEAYSYNVVEDEGTSPAISITAPAPEASFIEPASFAIRVDVSGVSDIEQVDFYAGDNLLGTRSQEAEYVWTNVPSGTYTIHAVASRNDGSEMVSDSVSITVEPGGPISNPTTQTISLKEGWNLVSTRVAPDPSDMESLFSPIANHVSLVKDDQGAAFIPGTSDEIGHWNPLQAYAVYATEGKSLTVDGIALNPASTRITLSEGWNMIPVLSETSLPISDALSPISDVLVMVKDGQGNVYIPQLDVNEIGPVVPGRGYRVFVSDDTELLFPGSGKTALRSTPSNTEDPPSASRR